MEIFIKHAKEGVVLGEEVQPGEEFARMTKDCTCYLHRWCCCCRPEMNVEFRTPEGYKKAGRIVWPCACCNCLLDVYDGFNNITARADSNCCQCSWCCNAGYLGRCCDLNIPYEKNPQMRDMIRKRSCRECKECCADCEVGIVRFPQGFTPMEKFNVVCAAIMAKFMWFERRCCCGLGTPVC